MSVYVCQVVLHYNKHLPSMPPTIKQPGSPPPILVTIHVDITENMIMPACWHHSSQYSWLGIISHPASLNFLGNNRVHQLLLFFTLSDDISPLRIVSSSAAASVVAIAFWSALLMSTLNCCCFTTTRSGVAAFLPPSWEPGLDDPKLGAGNSTSVGDLSVPGDGGVPGRGVVGDSSSGSITKEKKRTNV